MTAWTVVLSRDARKMYQKLERSGVKKPSVLDVIDLLTLELGMNGPYLSSWPHYSPLGKDHFHCHLRKGHPTYVACWRIADKQGS
jgi:hypothetical protein